MVDNPMDAIDRVRQALAMAEAGYPVRGVDLLDAEGLLNSHDKLRKALWVISEPNGIDSLSGARAFAKLALTPTST